MRLCILQPMNTEIIITGVSISLSLIVAIGPQNTFVFSNAVRGRYVGTVTLISIVCDSALASLGVLGVGPALARIPFLSGALVCIGLVWLMYCAGRSLSLAFKRSALQEANQRFQSTKELLLSAIAFSLLNPHAYLDSVFLIGSFSAGIAGPLRLPFYIGILGGISLWFILLSLTGRLCASLLKSESAWRILHVVVALSLLWSIAFLIKFGIG